MGSHDVRPSQSGAEHRAFMAALLRDLDALDRLIREGRIESGVRRIGAEQEMVLVDASRRPAPRAMEILEEIERDRADDRITNELARFNVEANVPPLAAGPGMLEKLQSGVEECVGIVREVAARHGCEPVLTGILPTLELRDLGPINITPKERYFALDRLIREMRGRDYELYIKGTDELAIRFPSIMLEALNTSFQVHLQVSAEEFVPMYNLAQAIAGPVLAACVNSPMLFGRRLWQETRIAIFQQAVDTRRTSGSQRETLGRVRFGDDWVRESAVEIFRTDIARFRLLFGCDEPEDPIAAIERGEAPRLEALAIHNGTVYRWNRPCYGRTDGRPHLRIENRYLPSGPTIIDEVANTALWIGAMLGGGEAFGDVTGRMAFDDAAGNFVRAARQGLDTNVTWLDGESRPVRDVITEEIAPAARAGLASLGLGIAEIDRYIGIVEARVRTGMTGAAWQVRSFDRMRSKLQRSRAAICLTAEIAELSASGQPGHTWEVSGCTSIGHQPFAYSRVEQFMSTNLFTVREDELVTLVAKIMDWEKIRHVLVEDEDGHVVGIISWRRLIRFLCDRSADPHSAAASDVMVPDPVTAAPHTPATDVIDLMRENRVSAVPVVDDGRLVGIVTEHDFMRIAGDLLEERLRGRGDGGG